MKLSFSDSCNYLYEDMFHDGEIQRRKRNAFSVGSRTDFLRCMLEWQPLAFRAIQDDRDLTRQCNNDVGGFSQSPNLWPLSKVRVTLVVVSFT